MGLIPRQWGIEMQGKEKRDFQSLTENVGRFNLSSKTVLIPEMNRIGTHLIAAAFRGFGINARVLPTFDGLALGNEYSSGKECFPCQITLGDILHFLQSEAKRLREAFDPEDYIYFMPEADGPCRFGMYNKYQRIVLDSFPELSRLKIGSLTTGDGYSLNGMIEKSRVRDLRKNLYLAVLVGDVLDRVLWRIRPYEKEAGEADAFIEGAMIHLEKAFEKYAAKKDFDRILKQLEEMVKKGKGIIDPAIGQKPLIGVVGEIYLRTHVKANQDVIRVLEKYGAEVMNASIAEWVNYTSYDRFRDARAGFVRGLRQFKAGAAGKYLRTMIGFGGDLLYQEFRQKKVYERIKPIMDLARDHKVGHLDEILKETDLFHFDVGTEACLSIAGLIQYVDDGYNGLVNVYPFTCMPSTITSAIAKPLMNRQGIPYIDTPYDSSIPPGREAAIRTFMYQAHQHFKQNGRNSRTV
ncbi:MAG TPA: CoA activase [Deltaproteobacteria bacterium]|nr:CoA activase [Deltaproteobacteria bacterium]HIJ35906.1 CoA activase [Deltaproteobacteria bacterium]HIJ40140.1 CoA activase [Deltaproteobacteria bacterium]